MCSNIGTATSLLTGLRETSGARIHCHRWIWAALISSTKNNQVNPQQREQNRLTLYVIFSNTHDSKKLIDWPCMWFFMTQKKLSIFCTFHLIFRQWNTCNNFFLVKNCTIRLFASFNNSQKTRKFTKFYTHVKTFECKFTIYKRQRKSSNLYQTPSVIQEPPGLVLGGSEPERGGGRGGQT